MHIDDLGVCIETLKLRAKKELTTKLKTQQKKLICKLVGGNDADKKGLLGSLEVVVFWLYFKQLLHIFQALLTSHVKSSNMLNIN